MSRKNIIALSVILLTTVVCAQGERKDRLSWSGSDFIKSGFRNAPWIRDPFFPEEKKVKLSGIISGELAFVNGRWVKQGDSIDGYLVKTISPNEVILTKQAEVLVVKLHH